MTKPASPEHFKGKKVSEHLKDARKRGAMAMAESHATELSGFFSACFHSGKETAIAFLILWAAASALEIGFSLLFPFFIAFGFGWILWKVGRSALLGWARLERLHRVIEEERWEIEHHREQEKQELYEMYQTKGFSGKFLDDVVDILMADDNRLLRVMLEEELGLSLEVYEHPLKQALGALVGAFSSAFLSILAFYFLPLFGIPIITLLLIAFSAYRTAQLEKRSKLNSVIWYFSLATFAAAATYFLAKLLPI